jgi:hypothetical protein
MHEQDLQIHLRRRYVEQAQARRPRLPQRLRALGAVGPVLRPLPANSQQAFVQVRVTNVSTTGRHLSYLTHAKGPARQEATLFGPAAAATRRFVQEAQHDPHQFRLVVSVPDHPRLDRTRYIELCMAQVERDLGRPLDWLATHHFDTQHPHTHIVIRGRDRNGKDLYMERDYYQFGLRVRASQLLTWFFGPQQVQQREAERLAFNGVPKGLDDPDERGRVAQTIAATGPDDDRPPGYVVDMQTQAQTRAMAQATDAGRPPADVLAQFRGMPSPRASVPQASVTPVPMAEAPMVLENLAARVVAMQQVLQVQAQAMQRGQGLGF